MDRTNGSPHGSGYEITHEDETFIPLVGSLADNQRPEQAPEVSGPDDLDPLTAYGAFTADHKLGQMCLFGLGTYAGYRGLQLIDPGLSEVHPMLDAVVSVGTGVSAKMVIFRAIFAARKQRTGNSD